MKKKEKKPAKKSQKSPAKRAQKPAFTKEQAQLREDEIQRGSKNPKLYY